MKKTRKYLASFFKKWIFPYFGKDFPSTPPPPFRFYTLAKISLPTWIMLLPLVALAISIPLALLFFLDQRWDVNERNVVFGFVFSFRFSFVRKFRNLRFFRLFRFKLRQIKPRFAHVYSNKNVILSVYDNFFICGGCIAVRHQNVHDHNKNKWFFLFFFRKIGFLLVSNNVRFVPRSEGLIPLSTPLHKG